MQKFQSGGITIAFAEAGDTRGDPILLIHGFSSNHRVNWVETGWVDLLAGQGRRVVALDNRGHGESEKLYDPSLYASALMAEDSRALLDHLRIGRADVVGYSMGAHIAAHLAILHGDRVRSLVLGGYAESMLTGREPLGAIVAGLEAPSLEEVVDPEARSYRIFAERTGGDLKALAACMRAGRPAIATSDFATIAAPTLVVVGAEDDISGAAEPLAAAIPGAQAVTIPGKTHMSAVGAREHKEAVTAFLERRP